MKERNCKCGNGQAGCYCPTGQASQNGYSPTPKDSLKDEDVIKAVIEKAVKNGYEVPDITITAGDELTGSASKMRELYWEGKGYYGIIFDLDFAQALWGEEEVQILDTTPLDAAEIKPGQVCHLQFHKSQFMPLYQWHLQNLAIAPNRIEYLKQFIE